MLRLWLFIASVLLLQARYEYARRRGPLEALTDSMVAGRPIECVSGGHVSRPGQPPYRTCLVPADSSAFYYVGRDGRVLSVVRNWPSDSVAATTRSLENLRGRFGEPSYQGDDTHGNTIHQWRVDSLCVSLYEPRREPYVQLVISLPELDEGRCP